MQAKQNDERVIDMTRGDIQNLVAVTLKDTLPGLLADLQSGSNGTKEWLSEKEGRAFLGFSKATMLRRRQDGTLPYSKIEGSIFYRRADLMRVLENNLVTS